MDFSTTYMGMTLKNPIVPSASPLSRELSTIKQMEDEGAAAIVLYSLFEEQITGESHALDHFLSFGTDTFGEAMSYFPEMDDYSMGPDEYLNHIREAKAAVDIPIIGSLNGVSTGGWIDFAKKIEEAGADGLELNIYYIPTNANLRGEDVEQMYLDVVHDVKQSVSIPVAVKLSPFFSSTANMGAQLEKVGADALVLFNRFYQPDFDLEELEVVSALHLSDSTELLLPLRWTAILSPQLNLDLAITSGVHTHFDVLKGMMAGAKVTMMASELLQNGVERISQILQDLADWMEQYEYESIVQMQGSMNQRNVAEPAAFERANYMKVLQSYRLHRI